MLRLLPFGICFLLPLVLWGQIERIFDENGHLQAINPLNEEGEYHGTGYSYYPSGALKTEIPYREGDIEGELKQYYENGALARLTPYRDSKPDGLEKEFFSDSSLKATRHWRAGKLDGWAKAFFPSGELYLYTYLQQDSILFSQRFNEGGQLLHELVGTWEQPLDTLHLLPIRYSLPEAATSLVAGQPNRLQVVVPGVPLALVRYSARGAQLERQTWDKLPWFLTLVPEAGVEEITVFLRISLRPGAAATLLRSVKVPVSSP